MSTLSDDPLGILEPEKDSEIELIKTKDLNFNKKTLKGSPRIIEVKREEDNKRIIVLKKDGKEKETCFGIKRVSEVRHNEATNLIQLTSQTNELIILRLRTKASKDRWIRYLTTLIDNHEENIYEKPDEDLLPKQRPRFQTADSHKYKPRKSTPREHGKVQSVIDSHTIRIPPTPSQDILGTIQEGFDITASGAQALSSIEEDSTSMRFHHQAHGPSALHPIYANTPHSAGTVFNFNMNISVQEEPRQARPTPPKRDGSLRSGLPWSTGEPVESDEREQDRFKHPSPPQRQEKSLKDKKPPPTLPRRRDLPARDQFKISEFDGRENCGRDGGVSFPQNQGNQASSRVSGGAQEPPMSYPSAEGEENPYVNTPPPGFYVISRRPTRRPADVLRSEQNGKTVVQSIDRRHLRKITMKTMSTGGVWIKDVPEELKGIFYQGDKIKNINEQRIFDETFARNIIETSEKTMIGVTVERLPIGHVIEMTRTSPGDPLGFQLNGTQITSISPATPFARQATAAFAEVMCVTHINQDFVPLHTSQSRVNQVLREAGLSFFMVIQPLDFMRELTRR